tara:strand:- start:78 stop:434 length:357 start_codon:yes stop_codon:yes gene_type:complete
LKKPTIGDLSTIPENRKLKKKNKKKKKSKITAKSRCLQQSEGISSFDAKSTSPGRFQNSKEDDSTANDSDSSDSSFEKTLHQFCLELSHAEQINDQPRLVPNFEKEWLCGLKSSINKK